MSGTFAKNNLPGWDAARESEEIEVRAAVEKDANPIVRQSGVIDSTVADSGNTPTTTIRGGYIVARKDADGNIYLYDPDADDGTQVPVGILSEYVDMLKQGAAADRWAKPITHGIVKESALKGADAHGLAVLHAMGIRVIDQDTIGPAGHEFLVRHRGAKQITSADLATGDYTVTAAENGFLFIAEGADTNFILPTIAHGLAYEFLMSTNHELVITGSNNIIALNDSAASTLTWTTDNQQIGAHVRMRAIYMGSTPALRWLVENLTVGATVPAIA